MGKIISQNKAREISQELKKKGKRIVVAGGVFDILHIGHLKFLEGAKKEGDALFVLIESDERVKKIKGNDRPINNQEDRAMVVAALKIVDFVIPLKEMTKDSDYDTLMAEILPNTIATTKGDPNLKHKERQARKIGGTIKFVTNRIGHFSTTRLTKLGQG